MNLRKTGKIITVMTATVDLITSLLKDKKAKERKEEK